MGNLPAHRHRLRGHAAAVQGIRREAGPEHEAVGDRIARGDAERERVGGKARLPVRNLRAQGRRERRGGHGAGRFEEPPAGQPGALIWPVELPGHGSSLRRTRWWQRLAAQRCGRVTPAALRSLLPFAAAVHLVVHAIATREPLHPQDYWRRGRCVPLLGGHPARRGCRPRGAGCPRRPRPERRAISERCRE